MFPAEQLRKVQDPWVSVPVNSVSSACSQPTPPPWTTLLCSPEDWDPGCGLVPVTSVTSPSVVPLASRCLGSGFKENPECGPDLRDHVGGSGGTAMLLEGLAAALPYKRARTHGSQEERAGPGEGRPSDSRGLHTPHTPTCPPSPPRTPDRPFQVCCASEAQGSLTTRDVATPRQDTSIPTHLENRTALLPRWSRFIVIFSARDGLLKI